MSFDFEDELRGDGPMNAKGNDWVASIVGGLIVGGMLAGTNYLLGKDKDDSASLVDVQKGLVAVSIEVKYLATSVTKLTEQPYVRREEFNAGIKTLEDRLSGFNQRVDSLEQRARRSGR